MCNFAYIMALVFFFFFFFFLQKVMFWWVCGDGYEVRQGRSYSPQVPRTLAQQPLMIVVMVSAAVGGGNFLDFQACSQPNILILAALWTWELVETLLDILDSCHCAGGVLEMSGISVQRCIFKYLYSCTIFGWEYPSRRYPHVHVPIQLPKESINCTPLHQILL